MPDRPDDEIEFAQLDRQEDSRRSRLTRWILGARRQPHQERLDALLQEPETSGLSPELQRLIAYAMDESGPDIAVIDGQVIVDDLSGWQRELHRNFDWDSEHDWDRPEDQPEQKPLKDRPEQVDPRESPSSDTRSEGSSTQTDEEWVWCAERQVRGRCLTHSEHRLDPDGRWQYRVRPASDARPEEAPVHHEGPNSLASTCGLSLTQPGRLVTREWRAVTCVNCLEERLIRETTERRGPLAGARMARAVSDARPKTHYSPDPLASRRTAPPYLCGQLPGPGRPASDYGSRDWDRITCERCREVGAGLGDLGFPERMEETVKVAPRQAGKTTTWRRDLQRVYFPGEDHPRYFESIGRPEAWLLSENMWHLAGPPPAMACQFEIPHPEAMVKDRRPVSVQSVICAVCLAIADGRTPTVLDWGRRRANMGPKSLILLERQREQRALEREEQFRQEYEGQWTPPSLLDVIEDQYVAFRLHHAEKGTRETPEGFGRLFREWIKPHVEPES